MKRLSILTIALGSIVLLTLILFIISKYAANLQADLFSNLTLLGVVTLAVLTFFSGLNDSYDLISKVCPSKHLRRKKPSCKKLEPVGACLPGWHLDYPRNKNFVGRDADLITLANGLFHVNAGYFAIPQVLVGRWGGIGKTQLAVEFCYRYGRFTLGVYWIQANLDIESQIAECGSCMTLDRWPDESLSSLAKRTIDAWKIEPNRLIVLDNLEDPAILNNWLPDLQLFKLLITSRWQDWSYLDVKPHRLDRLERDKSLKLLHLLAPHLAQTFDPELDTLAEILYDTPLALQLAGLHLHYRPNLTPSAYIQELKNRGGAFKQELLPKNLSQEPTQHNLDLYAAFLLSWDQLFSDEPIDSAARILFLAAGYCVPDIAIPVKVFQAILNKSALFPSESGFGLQVALQSDTSSGLRDDVEKMASWGLSRLYQLGLLDSTSNEPHIHPIFADFSRNLDERQPKSILSTLATCVREIAHKSNEAGFPQCMLFLSPHLPWIASFIERTDPEQSSGLWLEWAIYLNLVADYERAKTACERALSIAENVIDQNSFDFTVYLSTLGRILKALGDLPAALGYFQRSLHISEIACGYKDLIVAIRLIDLGDIYNARCDLESASACFERALCILEASTDLSYLKYIANCLGHLGIVLRKQRRFDEARDCHEKALQIGRQILDPEDPDMAVYLTDLGLDILSSKKDLDDARDIFERALIISEKAYGYSHPIVARRLVNLGDTLRDQGNLIAALDNYKCALEIRKKVFGELHIDTAESIFRLGYLYYIQDKVDEARICFEQALAIYRQKLPPSHPDFCALVNFLKSLNG